MLLLNKLINIGTNMKSKFILLFFVASINLVFAMEQTGLQSIKEIEKNKNELINFGLEIFRKLPNDMKCEVIDKMTLKGITNFVLASRELKKIFDSEPLKSFIKNKKIRAIQNMLNNQNFNIDITKNINTKDKYGNTALMWAIWRGYTKIVKVLVLLGCDFNIKDTNGISPLILAVYHDRVEIVKMLVSFGADLNHENDLGNTCFDVCSSQRTNGYGKSAY